jgi:hypothetical protein
MCGVNNHKGMKTIYRRHHPKKSGVVVSSADLLQLNLEIGLFLDLAAMLF